MVRRSRLRPVGDVAPADWVVAGVGPFGSGVGGLVPHGFEAYARILHPASAPDGHPVTWAEVAAWSGRVVHPRVQFRALATPASAVRSAKPWDEDPDPGTLAPAVLAALCDGVRGLKRLEPRRQLWRREKGEGSFRHPETTNEYRPR